MPKTKYHVVCLDDDVLKLRQRRVTEGKRWIQRRA
ncbi:uncharacterized protein G2W53_022240 [Senna tora]|uniref:Uncharacterized protein n=1 Tax=Senna tora TaxID=362788 RepID=A0A834TNC6_9FABA|nr:uncharacterized protein G2W53_022240 [Senna tora]